MSDCAYREFPPLAILHGLAAERSTREMWWLFGARNGKHDRVALESRASLRLLRHGLSRIWYSRPTAADRLGTDFDAARHMTVASFDALKFPRDPDCYLCGPTAFMHALRTNLVAWGGPSTRIHTETFASRESRRTGIVDPHELTDAVKYGLPKKLQIV